MEMKCEQCNRKGLCDTIQSLKCFYFTYGSEQHDYIGGWSEVYAANREEAVSKFNSRHESKYPEHKIPNCASIYDENEFKNTKMFKNGNFDARCHEVII